MKNMGLATSKGYDLIFIREITQAYPTITSSLYVLMFYLLFQVFKFPLHFLMSRNLFLHLRAGIHLWLFLGSQK